MEPQLDASGPPRWSLLQRIAFRFAAVYFLLYNLPFPLDAIPLPPSATFAPVRMAIHEWVTKPWVEGWNAVVVWVGRQLFGLDITIRPNGSGDTTWNYVQVLCMAVIAAGVTVVWSLVDRQRPNYARLHEWLRIYLRFALAHTMIQYGAVKVIPNQFPPPGVDSLMGTYGESSPMHLVWTFMGASEPYTIFAGAGEMLGGLLLTTRRTTLLGTLISFGVLAHIVALNFCYDIPVKLFSLQLLFTAVFLMAPDLPWLMGVLVLGRRVAPPEVTPLTGRKWLNCGLVCIRTIIVVAVVWQSLSGAYRMRQQFIDVTPKAPLVGVWETDEFELDGQVRPPLTTDGDRWHHLTIGQREPTVAYLMVRTMTGDREIYTATNDAEKRVITLLKFSPPGSPPSSTPPAVLGELSYNQPADELLTVEGKLNGRRIKAKLRYVDPKHFLLVKRGFHWINETPYNVTVPRKAGAG